MQHQSISPDPEGESAQIPLRARDGSIRAYAIVDAADAEWVGQWRWHLNSKGYAARTVQSRNQKRTILLHRELMGLGRHEGPEVDHIDLDRLNNRRGNLRVVPKDGQAQNQASHQGSSSSYRGVSWHKQRRKWAARIKVKGRDVWLGLFDSEAKAAKAAQDARARSMPFAMEQAS